ncbi:MAG: NAD-dependent epimerase/dehydratase family protein [Planctomycetota bacterium]
MTHLASRRDFLLSSLAAASVAPLLPEVSRTAKFGVRDKQRILILGGTGFLGPAVVDAALARGHEVVLFNRGKTNADLYPQLEKLHGDRDTGDLKALEGQRFDAVVDTSAYVPSHVAATAKLAAEQAKTYVMVSSISVYPAFGSKAGEIDEDAETAVVPGEVVDDVATIRASMREGGRYYGGFKALCEKAAETAMPGRVANIRPGLIVGPRDSSDRFTWWPVRIDRGGEVLAPGDPKARVQVIDVRDLGLWIVHCIENEVHGVFNATGFEGALTMGDMLGGCRCATANPVELVWADDALLREQQVGPWMEMPVWIPADSNSYAKNDRARAKGLVFRPIADTIRDTLAWAKEEAGRRKMFTRTGIAPEKEAKVIAAVRARR